MPRKPVALYEGSGRANVTEASYEIGYQGLSRFAKAFREKAGRTPQDWLHNPRRASEGIVALQGFP